MEIKKCKITDQKYGLTCPEKRECARADKAAQYYYGPHDPKAKHCVHFISAKSQAKRKR